jgi:hypothetical protein
MGCGKMKAGGPVKKVKKMAEGGSATNKLNNPRPATKPQRGGGNTKMGIYGVPNAGPTGPNIQGVNTMKKGGAVKMKKMQSGGSLKPVTADKVGLSKLPTAVRNKMGYQKKGGLVKAQKGKETGKDPVRNENTKDAAIGSAAYNKQFTSKAARDSANYYRNYAKSLAQYDSKNSDVITKNLDNLQRQYDKGKPGYDAMGYKKDSEGRSPSSKWYGFDPKTKKYTMGPNKGKTHGQVMKATKKK